MKKYLSDILKKFKEGTKKYKILIISLLIVYISICALCIIPVSVSYTMPGEINRIGNLIEVDNDSEEKSSFFTISVTSYTKCSLFQYLIAKLDKNTSVELYDYSQDYLTIEEDNKVNTYLKEQSIQDSIICAYDLAKKNGYDVDLIKTAVGVRVNIVLESYYNTGGESLKIGDIVISIDDEPIISYTDLELYTKKAYDQYLADGLENVYVPTIKVLRGSKKEEVTLTKCSKDVLCDLGYYAYYCEKYNKAKESYYYNVYDIDYANSKPSLTVNSTNVIGPSGGFLQALYIYDAITNNSIYKELYVDDAFLNRVYIAGTGTIDANGNIGSIGAIKQKITTANIYSIKYFFVASDNYEDALEQYNTLKDPSFSLYSVKTLEDAINIIKEVQ